MTIGLQPGKNSASKPFWLMIGALEQQVSLAGNFYQILRTKEDVRVYLVVLEANPLTVDPNELKDIAVVETIARGRTVYPKAESQ